MQKTSIIGLGHVPLKGAKFVARKTMRITPETSEGDRRLAVLGEKDMPISNRKAEFTNFTRFNVETDDHNVHVTSPDGSETILIPWQPDASQVGGLADVRIPTHKGSKGLLLDQALGEFFQRHFDVEETLRVVAWPNDQIGNARSKFSRETVPVIGFHDCSGLHVQTLENLRDIFANADFEFNPATTKANITLEGGDIYGAAAFKIGNALIINKSPTTRCNTTTLNPETGQPYNSEVSDEATKESDGNDVLKLFKQHNGEVERQTGEAPQGQNSGIYMQPLDTIGLRAGMDVFLLDEQELARELQMREAGAVLESRLV